MAPQEPQPTEEQPQTADSDKGTGLQPGGITPEVEQALGQLPEGERAKVMESIASVNADYTRRLQALSSHVRKSNALDQLQKIPDFREFIEAAQQGDLPGFYRKHLPAGQTQVADRTMEQPTELGHESTPETDYGMPADQVSAIKEQLEATQSQVAQIQQHITSKTADAEADRFTQANPDWKEWYPHIQAIKQESGYEELALQDALDLAKARVNRQPVTGEAAATPSPAQPAATQKPGGVQPPVPHGAVGTTDGFRQPRTITEAAEIARRQLGHGLGDVKVAQAGLPSAVPQQ